MAATFLTVASGQNVTSAFALTGTFGRAIAVYAAQSLNPIEIRLQFTTDQVKGAWDALFKADGSGVPFVAASTGNANGGWGLVANPPIGYGRIFCVASQPGTPAIAVRSFTVLELARS